MSIVMRGLTEIESVEEDSREGKCCSSTTLYKYPEQAFTIGKSPPRSFIGEFFFQI